MNLSTVKWAQWDKTQSRELLVCSYVCALHCAQLLHRTDLIIFPLTLQTIPRLRWCLFKGRGGSDIGEVLICKSFHRHAATAYKYAINRQRVEHTYKSQWVWYVIKRTMIQTQCLTRQAFHTSDIAVILQSGFPFSKHSHSSRNFHSFFLTHDSSISTQAKMSEIT